MSWWWILIPAALLLILGGGRRETKVPAKSANSHWIYHPHVIQKDDYECSSCHARSPKEAPVCPRCGTRMTGKTVTNEGEWMDEEEDLDILFDDD